MRASPRASNRAASTAAPTRPPSARNICRKRPIPTRSASGRRSPVSRAFQRPAFAPRWTWRLGAQYESPMPTARGNFGYITIGGQMRYRSRTALAVDNTYINGAVGTTTEVTGLFQDGYALVDARLVF